MTERLGRDFFARPTVAVARDLLGCRIRVDPGTSDEVTAVLVEVEAYLGTDDEASHAFRGPTPRAAVMFGPPGHLYVYLSYGVHHCANLVTEAAGVAGAVLLRAAAVEAGEEVVRRRREAGRRHRGHGGPLPAAALLRGPGNLCRGLGVDLGDNLADVCAPRSRVAVLAGRGPHRPVRGPRVGISRARDPRLRFAWPGHPAVSGPAVERPTGGGADGHPRT